MGNLYSALLAWLSARSVGGEMVLRIEDLDEARCKQEYAQQIEADLHTFGLTWDMGGMSQPEYMQSKRKILYTEKFELLRAKGMVYPCYCTRAQRILASAPHGAEGASGCQCRGLNRPLHDRPAWRLAVPDKEYSFTDLNMGAYSENLAKDCGDVLIRRADGLFSYQLAVSIDDGEMGITQVVRGRDLLSSTPRQLYILDLLGYEAPEYAHVPLLLAKEGRRLSKRDGDLDLGALLQRHTPQEILGWLAHWAGLLERPEPISAKEMIPLFSWNKTLKKDKIV